jgi:predicted DNA-binding transcriptional regulator AlpA
MSDIVVSTSPRLRLLDIDQLSNIIGTAPSVIYDWIKAGKFPKPIKIGRRNLWRESTLIRYLDRQDQKAGNSI